MALAGAALAVIWAPSAMAQDKRAAQFKQMLDCRALTDNAARLACYDAAAGVLDQAEKAGDIVVVDRDQARAARRQAFGFSLPSLSMFERGESKEELENLATVAKRAYRGGDNKWRVELEDGAVWAQTDNEPLPRGAKAGSKVEIRTTTMGGYFMKIDGQRAVRAQRVK
jgi:hypothetical protein